MKYTIVFHTQSGALKYDSKMRKLKIPCSLQPVPRKLSSSCGICAKLTCDETPESLMDPEVERIYKEVAYNHYELILENE